MLRVKNKKDREQMVVLINKIAMKHSCNIEANHSYLSNRCIDIDISHPSGLGVHFSLDGETSNPDSFLLPFCIRKSGDKCLSGAFGNAMSAELNRAHRKKCMRLYYGFDAALLALDRAFSMAADGTAYSEWQASFAE